jgi:hypothetical protein
VRRNRSDGSGYKQTCTDQSAAKRQDTEYKQLWFMLGNLLFSEPIIAVPASIPMCRNWANSRNFIDDHTNLKFHDNHI